MTIMNPATGFHLLFSIIIYDCFLHLLLTGLARYGPVYYPLENVTYTQCIQPMSHLLFNNNRFTSDYPLWGEFGEVIGNDKFDAVAVLDLIIGQFF